MDNTELKEIIEGLNENPIFKMSLGSKELFHSNFLEYLFNIELIPKSFIKMINGLHPDGIQLHEDMEYKLAREKEGFDICIYHKEGEKEVYDLVIENKVKSIPYKKQLMDYVEKAHKKGSKQCKFILLTLSDEFPDKDDKFVKNNWKVIDYSILKRHIESQYLKNNQISERDKIYIKDYCDFIKQLDQLKRVLIPKDQQLLFVQGDKKYLESIRLHDLYIKLRCSWFAVCLKNQLDDKGIKTKVINKFEELECGAVNINVAMNQGNGQIAVWICDCNAKGKNGNKLTNTFEIVIQGNQYRHGINQQNIPVKAPDNPCKLNILYNRLSRLVDSRPLDFLDFQGLYGAFDDCVNIIPLPDKKKKFKKTNVNKSGPFNYYGDSYIYRFKEIDEISISQLLKRMVDEAVLIFNNVPNLYAEKKV